MRGDGGSRGSRAGFVSNVLALGYREASVMRHDRALVSMIAIQPLMLLLISGFVLRNEPQDVPWLLLDRDASAASRALVADVGATGYFLPPERITSYEQGRALLERGHALAMLVIPERFARDAQRGTPEVQVIVDGADPLSAAAVAGILQSVAASFDAGRRPLPRDALASPHSAPGPLEVRRRFWFNPTLADKPFFLAAIAGILLTNLCLSLSSLGLVGERESGTFEQTLSLPTRPIEMVIGKLLPYVGLSYVVTAIAIVGAGLLFGVWPAGSWIALVVLTLPFVLASLSIGVFVSSVARTSVQAVFLTVFLVNPSMVLSGVMLSYQLMPERVRWIGALLPLRWYQIGLRSIVSRGGGLAEIALPAAMLTLIFAVLLALVRWKLRPRLG
jgi:ABC-2 type transport system permease protein